MPDPGLQRTGGAAAARVAVVSSGLGLGGAETMLLKLAPGLRERGIDMRVLSLRSIGPIGERLGESGFEVRALDLPAPGSPRNLLAGLRWLRAWQPGVVQGWMYHGNVAAWALAPWLPSRPRLVLGVRHSINALAAERPGTRLAIRLGARASRAAAAVLYNSTTSQRQHEAIGYARSLARVITNGFDPALFRPDPAARISVRVELGVDAQALLVGLFARHHPMKDHGMFLRAAARIAREVPQAHFVLAGTGVDGGNALLREQARSAGLAGRVHLLGERRDIARLDAALDVACLTSTHGDAFPNVLGEAMSCAVPCVSTDVGDTRQIVGDTGSIVAPGDDAALAAAVVTVLRAPEATRLALGAAARDRVIRHYSLDAVTGTYAALYRELCAGV